MLTCANSCQPRLAQSPLLQDLKNLTEHCVYVLLTTRTQKIVKERPELNGTSLPKLKYTQSDMQIFKILFMFINLSHLSYSTHEMISQFL